MAIQDKFNKPNVIYKITKDIDLGGETLTIPEGCTLDFQGGSFSNGTIVGNNTDIKADLRRIFGTDIEFGGIWNVVEVYPEWFGLRYNIKTCGKINVLSINKSIQLQVLGAKKVVVNKGDIYVDVEKYENTWGIDSPTIKLLSNSNIELKNARIIVNENDFLGYYVFSAINVQNVKLNGGVIIGDVRNHAGNDGEFGYGLYIAGSQNIQVSNMEFNEFWGDGIILIYDSSNKSESSGIDSEKHPRDIYIDNVKCLRNRRQGISICDGINIKISNSSFNETGSIKSTLPCSGMDLEPNGDFEFVKDVSCVNCEFKNNKGYSVTSWYNNNNAGREVTDSNLVSAYFSNCDFTSDTISKINVLAGKTMFTNCKFDEVWNATGTPNQGSYVIQDSEIKRVVFNGNPVIRVLKNCIFKDYNQYISWDNLNFNKSYLIDCTFIVNNNSIVYTNWGGAIYSTNIINIQPKIINIGDNPSYEMEIHKIQLMRPIVINCKLFVSTSKPKIITDAYNQMIASITNATSMSDGTLASVGKVPFFSYGGKWYDSMGYKPDNKRGLHGERPVNLTEDDAGYLFYNTSYRTWMFWDGTEWKRMGLNDIGEILGGEGQRPSGVNQGYQYFDVNLNKPIWWTGSKWVDATGATV